MQRSLLHHPVSASSLFSLSRTHTHTHTLSLSLALALSLSLVFLFFLGSFCFWLLLLFLILTVVVVVAPAFIYTLLCASHCTHKGIDEATIKKMAASGPGGMQADGNGKLATVPERKPNFPKAELAFSNTGWANPQTRNINISGGAAAGSRVANPRTMLHAQQQQQQQQQPVRYNPPQAVLKTPAQMQIEQLKQEQQRQRQRQLQQQQQQQQMLINQQSLQRQAGMAPMSLSQPGVQQQVVPQPRNPTVHKTYRVKLQNLKATAYNGMVGTCDYAHTKEGRYTIELLIDGVMKRVSVEKDNVEVIGVVHAHDRPQAGEVAPPAVQGLQQQPAVYQQVPVFVAAPAGVVNAVPPAVTGTAVGAVQQLVPTAAVHAQAHAHAHAHAQVHAPVMSVHQSAQAQAQAHAQVQAQGQAQGQGQAQAPVQAQAQAQTQAQVRYNEMRRSCANKIYGALQDPMYAHIANDHKQRVAKEYEMLVFKRSQNQGPLEQAYIGNANHILKQASAGKLNNNIQ